MDGLGLRAGTTCLRLRKELGEASEEVPAEIHEAHKEDEEGEDHTHSDKHQFKSFRNHFLFSGLVEAAEGERNASKVHRGAVRGLLTGHRESSEKPGGMSSSERK